MFMYTHNPGIFCNPDTIWNTFMLVEKLFSEQINVHLSKTNILNSIVKQIKTAIGKKKTK